jgi:hypothetical protein
MKYVLLILLAEFSTDETARKQARRADYKREEKESMFFSLNCGFLRDYILTSESLSRSKTDNVSPINFMELPANVNLNQNTKC